MEIAIANVTEQRDRNRDLGDVRVGGRNAFGEAGDRHADIGREAAAARFQLQAGKVGVMAGLPQAAAVFRTGRPFEIGTAQIGGNGLYGFGLFLDAARAAVEFEKEGRGLGQGGFAELVDRLQRQGVEQFDTGHGDAQLDGLDHGLYGGFDIRKRADGRGNGLGDRVELDGQLAHDGQGAFGADQEARQVVAGGGFAGAATGFQDAAISEHAARGQHVVLHRAVAHGVGARGTGGGHAAQGRVRTRIDREEQPRAFQGRVQLHPGHAGLHHRIAILGMDGENLVHAGHVQGNAALRGQHMALDRTADAIGNQGNAMLAAQPDHVGDFVGVLNEDHAPREHRHVHRLIASMLQTG